MDNDFFQMMWDRTAQVVEEVLIAWGHVESMTPLEVARRVLLGELETLAFVMDVEDRFPEHLCPLDDFHLWMLLQAFIKETSVGAPHSTDTMS
ncbi:hypothetical protein J0H33_05950 [bacterium]|nr:hypothetical protein [bacterium]